MAKMPGLNEGDTFSGGFLSYLIEPDYNALVAIRVKEPGSDLDGRIFIPKDVKSEYHEDTGETTLWIEVTEY